MLKFPVAVKRELKLSTALAMLGATIVFVVAIGLSVGYLFFWNTYNRETKPAHDLRVSLADVRANPQSVNARIALGWSYVENNNLNKALEQYRLALKMDPKNDLARYNVALLKIRTGDLTGARTDLESIQRDNPQYLPARQTLGLIYNRLGEYKLAVQELELVNSAQPGRVDVLYQLGEAYQALGNLSQAKAMYNLALQYNPTDMGVKQALTALN